MHCAKYIERTVSTLLLVVYPTFVLCKVTVETVVFIETKHHSRSVDTPEDLNEVKTAIAHMEESRP